MSTTNKAGQNMLLYTSDWRGHKTFKLLPVTEDCPYAEMIFDPALKMMALMSHKTKETFHMVEKLDDNGDPMRMKLMPRENGKQYKEERRALDTFLEYYLVDKEEIKNMVKLFAINAETYDYESYLNAVVEEPKVPILPVNPAGKTTNNTEK